MKNENIYSRRHTRQVYVGNVKIGGGAAISVQTMTKTKTSDARATIEQINRCAEAGADLIRVTVNDAQAAEAMKEICSNSPIPVIADIHFNHIFALKAIEYGVAKVRINPGNIGTDDRIKSVLQAAKDKGIPIRIGVNSGSLEKDILEKYSSPTAEALFESAIRHAEIAQNANFEDILIAVKSTSVTTTIAAYRLLSARTDFPLHLGVTEAGTIRAGTIKSAVGIGTLLAEGIGDTIRVSLTDEPEKEIEVGLEILRSLDLINRNVEIISCPTCGRLQVDLVPIALALEERCKSIRKSIKVALMGCAVNGPGEAREADIGIACGDSEALLFKKGAVIGKIPESDILDIIYNEILNF